MTNSAHHLGCITMVTGGLEGPCDCGGRSMAGEMQISFETPWRCLWHLDCKKSRSGVMREIKHEKSRTLCECLSCGQRGYYPVGGIGPRCVLVIGADEEEKP